MIQLVDALHSTSADEKQKCLQALQAVLKRQDLGFYQIPERQELWNAAERAGVKYRELSDDLVIVGIGGSSLGPKALNEIFESQGRDGKKIHFYDSTDALDFERVWGRLRNLSRTTWAFVSKSGSTLETLVAADLVQQRYFHSKNQLHAVVISENRSNPLTDWARDRKVDCLEIPQDVGGRFSVLCAVGMFPMVYLGIPIAGFQEGARKALQSQDLIAQIMAQASQSFQRGEWISFFWFYNTVYASMGRWIQQLWAESLAKTHNRKNQPAPRASTPMWGLGPSDQHSLLQQLMDGAKDKLIFFLRFTDLEKKGEVVQGTHFRGQEFFKGYTMGQLIAAQAQGTRQALNEHGASTVTLQVESSSPQSVGFQLMSWQLVVAGLGERLDLNAFDQPGVELGKRLAKQILQS